MVGLESSTDVQADQIRILMGCTGHAGGSWLEVLSHILHGEGSGHGHGVQIPAKQDLD